MRKIAQILIWVLGFLFNAAHVYAADSGFSVGVKSWYNDEERKYASGSISSIKTDNAALLVGPNIKLENGNFLAGVSYMKTVSDYEFTYPTARQKRSRDDLDAVVGIMLNSRFGIIGGYKVISTEYEWTYSSGNTSHGEATTKGPMYGITLNLPFDQHISFFASYVILKMKKEDKPSGAPTITADYDGSTIDAGILLGLSENVSASVGYRKEQLKDTKTNFEDIYSGITAGLDFRF